MAAAESPSPPDLASEVASVAWYHTIALPGVRTPGFYDTAGFVSRIPLPEDLSGKRCIDIGTCDGFWAFELERRGASEVVAVDLNDSARRDWPDLGIAIDDRRSDQGRSLRAFEIAHRAFGSRVERVDLSIYDLSPEEVGEFDFAFVGTLLLHLRDPVAALESVRSVVRGELMSMDVVSPGLSLLSRRPVATLNQDPKVEWWTPNFAAQKAIVARAGFEVTSCGAPVFLRFGQGLPPGRGRRAGYAPARGPVWMGPRAPAFAPLAGPHQSISVRCSMLPRSIVTTSAVSTAKCAGSILTSATEVQPALA